MQVLGYFHEKYINHTNISYF